MRHLASMVVALLTAAGILFSAFPKGNDFVFTRYAP